MDTDQFDADLRDRLDHSFGDGPTHRSLDDRLVAGRRALLLRRIGSGLVAAAVVAVLGTSYALASGGHQRAVEPSPAVATTSPATEQTTEPPAAQLPTSQPWRREFVRYTADLRLEVRPGATVTRRIRNPAEVEPPAVSDALEVRWKGTDYWMVLDADPGGSSSASIPAAPGGTWKNLSTWADALIASDKAVQGNDAPADDPAADFPGTNVRFNDDGALVADEGYRIVEQQRDVDLPENFAPAGATTAVALVERDGERTWWLGRIIDDQPDYIDFPAKSGQSVEEFLAFARDQYASEVGLR